MADEKKPAGSPMDDAIWFFGMLAGLIILWYLAGGPGKADLKGLFLAPPAPLGTGEAYGPTFEDNASSTAPLEAPAPLEDTY